MPFALKAGLMKPRKGFTPVTGEDKTGERKGINQKLRVVGYEFAI
jgi:hypothetical protein